jgi:hypothetical protein
MCTAGARDATERGVKAAKAGTAPECGLGFWARGGAGCDDCGGRAGRDGWGSRFDMLVCLDTPAAARIGWIG